VRFNIIGGISKKDLPSKKNAIINPTAINPCFIFNKISFFLGITANVKVLPMVGESKNVRLEIKVHY
jgi:hypothetical protein